MKTCLFTERRTAIFQMKQGKTAKEIAKMLNRSVAWVYKWQNRYETDGWAGLKGQSRAPKKHGKRLSPSVQQAIRDARLILEVEAALGTGLKYIGGMAVKTKLKQDRVFPLPSISSIERVLHDSGLTQKESPSPKPDITYPRLRPNHPHQLYQVDIVPHFLQGGQHVSCFNAIDVISRYPTGQAFAQKRAEDAAKFLIHVWQQMGIPRYTQVDNESCFSGGFTHEYVLGQVVRLALHIGTELLFSPTYYPKSNGYIERFHQDYNRHVWEDTYLNGIKAVNLQSNHFFSLYRHRQSHGKLQGRSPESIHSQISPRRLDVSFVYLAPKIPLRSGRIHFIRRVNPDGIVRVLNANWTIPKFDVTKGVWVTINFQVDKSTLSIFDAAPDVKNRNLLISHPFPLDESVQPFSLSTAVRKKLEISAK